MNISDHFWVCPQNDISVLLVESLADLKYINSVCGYRNYTFMYIIRSNIDV